MRGGPLQMIPIRAMATVIMVLVAGSSLGADVTFLPDDERGPAQCMLNGEIMSSDIAAVTAALRQGCPTFYINSPGGDVDTALEIGKRIRAAAIPVAVGSHDACASACVFLYAAGVQRVPYGPVYIHRPYLLGTGGSYTQTQATYADLDRRVRAYLKSMNVNPGLLDEMMRVPPEQSRALGLKEMERYGMGLFDPVYVEYMDNASARKHGLTKEQFLARKREATTKCGGTLEEIIPERQLQAREACWRSYFPKLPGGR